MADIQIELKSGSSEEGITLRPGNSSEFKFSGDKLPGDSEFSLFITGETALHYLWKNEPDYPMQYHVPDDALNTSLADKAPYCVDLSNCKPVNYSKLLYKKVIWPPVLSYLGYKPKSSFWRLGISAMAKALTVQKDGYIRIKAEIRFIKKGKGLHSAEGYPDTTFVLDIPAGTYSWQQLSMPIEIPADTTGSVGILIEGYSYTGEIYLESPVLESFEGYNFLPHFGPVVPGTEKFAWTGMNLSRKEWPEFEVVLNGKKVFSGEVFERCHRRSEWSVDLDAAYIVPEENNLSITLTSDYHDPLPYTIFELRLTSFPGGALQLLSCPETAIAGEIAPVLIRTRQRDSKISVECNEAIKAEGSLHFSEPGLHVLNLRCLKPAINAEFTLRGDQGIVLHGTIPRIVERMPDDVITGTGDLIYVNQNKKDFEDFFIWYCANHIGNLLTIRPTYRWSGTRVLNPEAWAFLVSLLNKMNVTYALMIDGRELPGISANPHTTLLEGKGFLGSQLHERDGAFFYWGAKKSDTLAIEQRYDLEQKFFREHPENTYSDYASFSYIEYDGNVWRYKTPGTPKDMKEAAEFAINSLRQVRHGSPRHTGPSVMFKYFYQAGFEWAGAETMYSSMEPLMAFVRGAALGYHKKAIGVHHAVQWSTSPHDTPERFRRYRLALYTSYIQGATEINTEEGLWHIEEYFSHHNRYGTACKGHLKVQQDFYRWVSTHSRTGTFHATLGLLHGRFDGWLGWGGDKPWGLFDTPNADPENSWDLLGVFYPLSKPGEPLYIHDCPVEPLGYYSGNPRGNIDAIPIEADLSILSRYPVLALLGYNHAEKDDLDKLWAYMENGGRLLMGWPHLITTTDRQDLVQYRHNYISNRLTDLLGGAPSFTETASSAGVFHTFAKLSCTGETLEKTADGIPLVQKYTIGKGDLYFINAMEYPAAKAVRPLYEKVLISLSDKLVKDEPSFIRCNDDVQFAIYDNDDQSRHIYVLAVDWYNPPEKLRNAELLIGNVSYPLAIPFGILVKIVVSGKTAAWSLSEDGDVLSISERGMKLQGTGIIDFQYIAEGSLKIKTVDFSNNPVQEVGL
ncbi:hypothetical protein FACS189447_01130 [Spirochaetia bacterium]|nr:hypothetical protein FACS189447_01130 [Spirochaetia bacterium]